MTLGKEQLLGVKLKQESIPAPEFGPDATVIVLEPDAATAERLSAADMPIGQDGHVGYNPIGRLSRWTIACVVDEDGRKMFTDADAKQVEQMPASLLKRIVNVAQRLAGNTTAALAEDVKNS